MVVDGLMLHKKDFLFKQAIIYLFFTFRKNNTNDTSKWGEFGEKLITDGFLVHVNECGGCYFGARHQAIPDYFEVEAGHCDSEFFVKDGDLMFKIHAS